MRAAARLRRDCGSASLPAPPRGADADSPTRETETSPWGIAGLGLRFMRLLVLAVLLSPRGQETLAGSA